MSLQKIALLCADKLSKSMASISEDAEISGYLVGLLQDVRNCVETNLKSRPGNDCDDIRLINDVIGHLETAKLNLSCILSTDIKDWTDNKH